ncbi:MAG: aminotransferase class V-fold PLP-dependent enzyme [Planctomycetales bacterium]|nr:aminotransferase class V-fold PLP-dependent enzyme [Planctomycetales bacterium]
MSSRPIYMDNHATTRVDPRVVEAMAPFWTEKYGNAGSVSHAFGWEAKQAVDEATASIAAAIGAGPREIIFTSGATESNNLAILGIAGHRRRKGNHLVSVVTEHKAVLDPLARLAGRDFEVTLLDVSPHNSRCPGLVDLDQFAAALREDTALVSVMLANNEIGGLQPLAAMGKICKERGILLHCDAAQAVGKIPVDVQELQVDLLSFSGHKIYGPRGMGGLYVRRRAPHVQLEPQIFGGGQQHGLRSGTLNVPGIVGLAKALELCLEEMPAAQPRLAGLRQRLFDGITSGLNDVQLNGPPLDDPTVRLAGNLNLRFAYVDGEALMMSMGALAVSSGSACTSADPEPSHVLRALGLDDDQVRGSLRFGLGRFTTAEDVERAIGLVCQAVTRLRKLSSMAS